MYNNTFFWKMFSAKIALIESALTDSYHQLIESTEDLHTMDL